MKRCAEIGWLFLASCCVPLCLNGQTSQLSNTVSVRELSIPAKAYRSYCQGLELAAKKDSAGSLTQFDRAIAEYPGYFEAYFRKGAAELQLWRIADAEKSYRKSIEISGGRYAQPLLALAAILDDQKKFVEAESVARMGLELDSNFWTGHYYLGVALFGLNRFQEAEASVLEALRQKADFPQARLLLADILVQEKKYAALLIDLDEYLKLDSTSAAGLRVAALRERTQRMLADRQDLSVLLQTQP